MKTQKSNSKIEIIKLISKNIFFISDLPADATYEEIFSKFDNIEKKISLKLNLNINNICPGLPQLNLSKGELKNIKNRLNKKEVMTQERLFWFFNPEKILNNLNKEDMWIRAKSFIEKESIIHRHDGALLALIYLSTFDYEIREIEKWLTIIEVWNAILENEKLFEKIAPVENIKNFEKIPPKVFSNIIKYSLLDIAINSIKTNEINTLDHALYLIKEININNRYEFKDNFLNEIFNRIGEKISDDIDDLMHDRSKIKRNDSNSYSDIKFNKSLCQKTYNSYLYIIEPLLVIAFCHLEKEDYKLKFIRERALEVLYSLAIDFTWAKEREMSKKILNKASKFDYETPMKVRLKKLNKKLGKITVFKKKRKSYPQNIKKYIVYNPFRVLDIPVDSNSQEIQRAIRRLEIKAEYKFSSNLLWDLNFLPEVDINNSILNFTKKMISDSKEISKARLFWFANREKALIKVSDDETVKTAFYWYQNSTTLEEKHDSILLSLIFLLIQDQQFELIKEWANLLYLCSNINNDFSFENKLKRVNSKEELNIISKLELNKLIFNFIYDLLNYKDDILMIEFFEGTLDYYQKSADHELESNIVNEIKVNIFSLLIKQIQTKIQKLDSDKFIEEFEEKILPLKEDVLLLNNKYNLSYKNIDNIISEELIHYAINKFPYKSKDALNILYKAREINTDKETVDKIDELIITIKPEEAKPKSSSSDSKINSKNNKPAKDNFKIIFFVFIGFLIIYMIGLFI